MIILRRTLMPALVAASCLAPWVAAGQGTRDDYARAERFLNDDIKKLAFDGQVDPHWISGTDRFWYLNDGPQGKTFMIADAAHSASEPGIAAALRAATDRFAASPDDPTVHEEHPAE